MEKKKKENEVLKLRFFLFLFYFPLFLSHFHFFVIKYIQAGLNSHKVHIPLKLQYLIGGRKRTGLHPIIEETCTNIYFPSPFTAAVTGNNDEETTTIYVTGDVNNVTRVDDMLNKLAAQKVSNIIYKYMSLYLITFTF